jgi:acetyl esterase/lipase
MTAIPSPQPSDGTTLEWRIYPPGFVYYGGATPTPTPTPTPGPGVLVIHGGSWDSGSPFQLDIEKACMELAQSGFWVFAASYRLAPCDRITNQPAHDGTTAGNLSARPPEETDDVMALMIAARNSPQCAGHKIGILGSSVGGSLATYVALYRSEINVSGRPHWNPPGTDYRPDCVVTFSSPFDLSDQSGDDVSNNPPYILSVQNYVGDCSLTTARSASPISLVDSGTAAAFKPMYMIQAETDHTNPYRQIDDFTIALNTALVNACDYKVSFIPEAEGHGHALVLWPQHDPNYPNSPGHSIGDSVLNFFHQKLDN